jgi:hypothetical protein
MFPVRGRRRVDRAGIAAWRSDTARLENVLGSAVPAFVVTALVSGRAGVWDLARRSLRWRVPLRLLLFTAFLPALAIMILLNNVAEEIGWGRIRLRPIPRSSWSAPRRLVDDSIFWLFHVPSFNVETRSWSTTALVLGIFLLPQLGSRLITGWLYNRAGCSVLIAGLFHSMHNAIVNSAGLVAVVALPQFEVLVIIAGIVVLAAAIIAAATRGRLGVKRPESDADLNSEG